MNGQSEKRVKVFGSGREKDWTENGRGITWKTLTARIVGQKKGSKSQKRSTFLDLINSCFCPLVATTECQNAAHHLTQSHI